MAANILEDRDAWLAERRLGIGSSDAAAACGLDPYKTPLQLYLEKRGEIAEEDLSGKPAVELGNLLEPVIAQLYEKKYSCKLQRVNRAIVSKTHPYMRANLDRRVVGVRHIVELKTAGYWAAKNDMDWGPEDTDQVPIRYAVQVQHQLHVADYDSADLMVLVGGQEPRRYVLQRDKELIAMVVQREGIFWQRVIDGNPPPITTLDDALLRYPNANAKPVYASQEIAELVGSMQHLQRQQAELKGQFDAMKLRVMDFMAEGDTLMFDQDPIVTWKTVPTTSLDSKRLQKEKPEAYEAYVRRGETRRFNIVGGE